MTLTSEQEKRIRELFKLITHERNPEKVKVLSVEIARLLTIQGPLRKPNDNQLRIIELVAQGRTNREIAENLGISNNVVRNYLSRIYDKVGVNNRVQLALWYEARVHEGKLRRSDSSGHMILTAVNFMNGQRGTAEIASLLSAEFLIDIDKEWVDHLVSILSKQHLLALEQATTSTSPWRTLWYGLNSRPPVW